MFRYFSKTLCVRGVCKLEPHSGYLEKRIASICKLRFSSGKDVEKKQGQGEPVIQLKKGTQAKTEWQTYSLIRRMEQQLWRMKEDMQKVLMQSMLQQVKIKQIELQKKEMELKLRQQRKETEQKFKKEMQEKQKLLNQMEERTRKEMEEMFKKEMGEKQQKLLTKNQEQKQKEEQKNKNKPFIKKLQELLGLLFQLSAPFIAVFLGYNQFQDKINGLWLGCYLKNRVVQSEESYIEGSPIYQEMKKIIEEDSNNRVKLVVGSPGLGKSTSVQKLLKQKVEKGQVVYYYTFQSFKQSEHIETGLKEIINLLYGVRSKFTSKDYEVKKIKLVIDDINKLQRLSNEALYGFMYFAYAFAKNKNIDLVMISSSQSFVQKVSDSSFNKAGRLYIVQAQPTKQFITNLFMKRVSQQKFYNTVPDKQVWSELCDFVIEAGFTPRMITTMIIEKLGLMGVQKMTKSSIMEEFKRFREEDIDSLSTDIEEYLKQMKDTTSRNLLVHLILKQKELKLKNCVNITTQFPNKTSNYAIQQLKLANLITFCKPKTRRERAAFERYLKKKN